MPRFTQPHPGLGLDWSNPINEGLVGYWPFIEGGGPAVGDYSGRGNNVTLLNGAAATGWEVLGSGSVLSLDNPSPWDSALQGTPILLNSKMTVSGFFYLDSTSFANRLGLFTCKDDYDQNGVGLTWHPRGDIFLEFNTYAWKAYSVDTSILDRLIHIAAVFNADGTSYVYIDGDQTKSIDTSGQTITDASADVSIGHYGDLSVPRGSTAKFGQLSFYQRLLTPVEIQQLYADQWAGWRSPSTSVFVPAAPAGGVSSYLSMLGVGS